MPLEHITGNIYKLPKDEKIVDSNGQQVLGPAMVRVTDFDDNFHSLQIDSSLGESRLEIEGNFENFVQKINPPSEAPLPQKK